MRDKLAQFINAQSAPGLSEGKITGKNKGKDWQKTEQAISIHMIPVLVCMEIAKHCPNMPTSPSLGLGVSMKGS